MLFIFLPFGVYAQSKQALSVNQWQEDVEFMQVAVEKTVPGFKESNRYKNFVLKITELLSNLPNYTEDRTILALQETLNTIGDEGCRIYPFQEQLKYKILPIKSYWFNDGVYIIDAIAEYKHLVGKKIIGVNNTSIDSLFAELQNTLNADNLYYQKLLFPTYMQIPAWLNGKGLGIGNDEVFLTFENNQTIKVSAGDVADYVKLNRNLAGEQKSAVKPNFRLEYLPEEKVLFVQLLRIDKDQDGKSFKKFVGEIEKELAKKDIEKMVIDNRYGGGGNGFKLNPFVNLIQKEENLNQAGNLFVLTSRATRGTILELTSMLELNSKAIIIGEPTGEGPNSVSDGTSIELPNSKIRVSLTKKYWPTSWPEDKRLFISPHKAVAYSFKDYQSAIDPWMAKVFQYKPRINPETSISKSVTEFLVGKYLVNDRQLKISVVEDKLFMSTERKMASFFGFNTQLYAVSPGKLGTDIDDVYLHYSKSSGDGTVPTHISWKGVELKIL